MREFSDGQVVPGTRYRVLRHLGSGGMGSVYLVEHTELGKQFVLKALFRELSGRKDLVARLRQEWRALARLNHANIVNVTDAGTSDLGMPFYVMEHVAGETLGDLLKREHAIGIPRAIGIAAAVLEGLSAAHEIGIVHRDVKPPNIFVTANGGVKMLDFGIAKLADQSAEVITARGIAIGTPRYMSPEQAKGREVDARADLYAAGLVLFESIAGAGPFDEARDANELLLFHITKPAPRLSQLHRGVSPELDDVVASLLAKDPSSRPASARQIAATLKALIAKRPVSPSTHGTTPQAGYQSITQGLVTVAPSTRPDGVAGRRVESTTVAAPLQPPTAATQTASPPSHLVTTALMEVPVTGAVAVNATATQAGMDWAKDGFDTAMAPVAPSMGVTHTQLSPPPSGLPMSEAPRTDRTLRIDGPSPLPPNDIATHTAVPPVHYEDTGPRPVLADGTPTGETPPPVISAHSFAPPPKRGLGPLLAVGGLVAFLGLAVLVFVGVRLLRPTPAEPTPAVASAPELAPPTASAEPAAPATATAEPEASASAGPAPSADPAPKPEAKPSAKPEPKPSAKPEAKPAKTVGRPLPASGL